jgi:hypothetical protein
MSILVPPLKTLIDVIAEVDLKRPTPNLLVPEPF